jgi:flavin reductase (DIM6/NTAB) family NADH-FMN oxidoreductase RutF
MTDMNSDSTPMAPSEAIAKSLGRIPSGCAILTAVAHGRRTGMLASWFQQTSFEPPMISVAVKKGRPIEKLIDDSGEFVLNLLRENPAAMFKQFGRGFTLEEDAFAGVAVSQVAGVAGGVALADALAHLSGRVKGKCDAGDHWLYIAEVMGADIAEIAPPYVHLRKNGLNY